MVVDFLKSSEFLKPIHLVLRGVFIDRADQGQLNAAKQFGFDLVGLDLPVASLATLCRRRKALSIKHWVRDKSEPLDLVLDSMGLKIFGQGEWCRAKHGRKRHG
ncbi:MAG: transposase [Geminicoccaceae bacterium]